MELLVDEVLRQEDEADEMYELTNSMVETEAELIDDEVDDDGDEVTRLYEMVVEMMINEQVEEVDTL